MRRNEGWGEGTDEGWGVGWHEGRSNGCVRGEEVMTRVE